jgi:hypothetical protein
MRNRFHAPARAAKTHINHSGYRVFNDSGIAVHRYVASNALGRPLKPAEVVHHKDRNKQNNAPGNLQVFSNQKAHDTAHKIDARRFGAAYSYAGKKKN